MLDQTGVVVFFTKDALCTDFSITANEFLVFSVLVFLVYSLYYRYSVLNDNDYRWEMFMSDQR